MKKILITGKNSYVGNSFEAWIMSNYPNDYQIEKLSLRHDNWENHDFSAYDVVLHVAGIAHMKETSENEELYYRVNRDLTYKIAKKAKHEFVSHFIFISSMSVYGMETGIINHDTQPRPNSNYGKSKLEGEELIKTLNDRSFKVTILRPPMIYGPNCKGNYVRLSKLAIKSPVFPNIYNRRSMIFIDNLSEFIRLIIEDEKEGLFFPQNSDYISTSDMVKEIAEVNGKNIRLIGLFNPLFKSLKLSIVNKVFGDLVYDKNISKYEKKYTLIGFKDSIYLTEIGEIDRNV